MNRREFFKLITSVLVATAIRLPKPPTATVVRIPYLIDQPVGWEPMFGVIKISKELLDDAQFDLHAFVASKVEAMNEHGYVP